MLLELYVVGHTRNSALAITHLRRLCERELRGRCTLHIVDILENPAAAESANIVATPTLIRRTPLPMRRIVGDLSQFDVVLDALGYDAEDAALERKGPAIDER